MKSIKKHSVNSCAINKISEFSSFKILNKILNLFKKFKLIQGGIENIPPHHIYQVYHFLSERDNCTPPKCSAPSEYNDSAHTEVEDPLGCMNESYMYGRYGHIQNNFILPRTGLTE